MLINGNGSTSNEPVSNENGENLVDNGEPGIEQNGSNSTQQPSWLAQLPKDLKEDEETIKLLSESKTIGDYVKSTLQKQKGTEEEGSKKEEDKPMVYGDTFDSKIPEHNDPFGILTNTLKDTLQKNKVSPEVAKEVFKTLTESQETSNKTFLEQGKTWCESELKKIWKDDYNAQRKAVTRGTLALQKFDPELLGELDKTGASITPAVARVIAIIGNNVKEDGSIGSNETRGKHQRDSRVPVVYPK